MNVFQIGLVGRQEASVEGWVLSRLLYDLLHRHWFLDRCGAWRAELGTATWHTWTSSTNHTPS